MSWNIEAGEPITPDLFNGVPQDRDESGWMVGVKVGEAVMERYVRKLRMRLQLWKGDRTSQISPYFSIMALSTTVGSTQLP